MTSLLKINLLTRRPDASTVQSHMGRREMMGKHENTNGRYGGFHKWGIPHSWMVYFTENASINGWELGVPPWLRTPPYMNHVFSYQSGHICSSFFPLFLGWSSEVHQEIVGTVEANCFTCKIEAFHIDLGALFLFWRDMDRSQNRANSNPQDCGLVTDLVWWTHVTACHGQNMGCSPKRDGMLVHFQYPLEIWKPIHDGWPHPMRQIPVYPMMFPWYFHEIPWWSWWKITFLGDVRPSVRHRSQKGSISDEVDQDIQGVNLQLQRWSFWRMIQSPKFWHRFWRGQKKNGILFEALGEIPLVQGAPPNSWIQLESITRPILLDFLQGKNTKQQSRAAKNSPYFSGFSASGVARASQTAAEATGSGFSAATAAGFKQRWGAKL